MTSYTTRKEYMDAMSEYEVGTPERKKIHHDYFCQFVTSHTIHFVESRIGLKRLQASTCEHLNDVVRWEQGGKTWLWDRSPINAQLAKELGEGITPSTRTCVGKAAARIILENAEKV